MCIHEPKVLVWPNNQPGNVITMYQLLIFSELTTIRTDRSIGNSKGKGGGRGWLMGGNRKALNMFPGSIVQPVLAIKKWRRVDQVWHMQ